MSQYALFSTLQAPYLFPRASGSLTQMKKDIFKLLQRIPDIKFCTVRALDYHTYSDPSLVFDTTPTFEDLHFEQGQNYVSIQICHDNIIVDLQFTYSETKNYRVTYASLGDGKRSNRSPSLSDRSWKILRPRFQSLIPKASKVHPVDPQRTT
ncbi:hypothetical protein [Deinococcus cellulosilyticus]|uniref:Uncharacterized protein n=1 Tax=Deinococcus cellulosilyticus (strain DSM 18568 / NBRC 106333 / KACC 11606 / 5516J-15) TaxID=1223518 RepID=A0A511NA52_DEIC1|nr:hypothetical protein [Deinococcus cellulosilyticus]GEM49704.1 hypothetical protein DC3_53390 [Deinococcus cellulosilyticus NBRC 106333 = KACC 11606]